MNAKRVALSGVGLLTATVAAAPGVLANGLNVTAITDAFSLIYVFIPIMILFMVLGWFFGMFDKIGKKI